MSPPALITSSLTVLRRTTAGDADALFTCAADPDVMRYMDWAMPTNVSSVRSHLETAHVSWDSGEEYQWVILDASGRVVGTMSVSCKDHQADFGYFLGRQHWGSGLGLDAARVLMTWLDAEAQILRIWATVDCENARSRRLLERLGLQQEGILRRATVRPNVGGPPRDTALYARIKSS